MADLQLQLAGAREKGAEEVSRHQETRDEVCMHPLEFENRCLLGVIKPEIYIETPYYSPWFEGFLYTVYGHDFYLLFQLLVLKKRQLKEEEVRCHYLQTLCEQLQTAGLPAGNPAPNGRDHAPSSPSGWGNLTDSTSAAAAAVLETLRQSKGEVSGGQSLAVNLCLFFLVHCRCRCTCVQCI